MEILAFHCGPFVAARGRDWVECPGCIDEVDSDITKNLRVLPLEGQKRFRDFSDKQEATLPRRPLDRMWREVK